MTVHMSGVPTVNPQWIQQTCAFWKCPWWMSQLSESSLFRKWPAVLANDQEFQCVSFSLKGILDLTDSWCVWLLYFSQMLKLSYIYLHLLPKLAEYRKKIPYIECLGMLPHVQVRKKPSCKIRRCNSCSFNAPPVMIGSKTAAGWLLL